MSLTTTTGANAIREAYAPGFNKLVFRNDSLFSLFPAEMASFGDTNWRFKANSAGNTSVQIFTEGQAQPGAGNQSWSNLAVPWNYYRCMIEITGHSRDALKSRWINAVDEEFSLGMEDLVDLMTTTSMSGTNGIETIVDSTTTYAGQARGSAAWWESSETAVGGALAHTNLEDLLETCEDNDKGALFAPGMWLMPRNQYTNVYRLSGGVGVQNTGDSDKAPGLPRQTFAGIPMVWLPDFTNTVIMLLEMTPRAKWRHIVHRPWDVKEMGPTSDADVYQLSNARLLVCEAPKYHGKLTGVTA
jgi:hypothetical protein